MKENNKVLSIIIILIIGIIIGVFGTLTYQKYFETTTSKEPINTPESINNEKEDISEEKDITDSSVIKVLDEKIEILNGYGADLVTRAPIIYKNIANNDIKEEDKIYMILFYNDINDQLKKSSPNAFDNLTGENVKGWPVEDILSLYINNDDSMYHFMEEEDLKKEYKDLFGVEPLETKVGSGYPNYYYEPNAKAYFQIARAGGACGTQFYQHKYKYTENKDNVFVYSSIGYTSCQEGLYRDYIDSNLKEEVATEEELSNSESPAKDYFDLLNKFKITFKKEENNYIFVKVEEIES